MNLFPTMDLELLDSLYNYISSLRSNVDNEISNSRALKRTYNTLGEVSHGTMFWMTLPSESLNDDGFGRASARFSGTFRRVRDD